MDTMIVYREIDGLVDDCPYINKNAPINRNAVEQILRIAFKAINERIEKSEDLYIPYLGRFTTSDVGITFILQKEFI